MEATTKSRFIWTTIIASGLLVCQGCKTVKPTASGRPNDISPSPQPTGSQNPVTAEVLEWVIIKPAKLADSPPGTGPSQGLFAWDIEVRTGPEIWCERRCSEFNLEETDDTGVRILKAVKTSTLGNTKPGMLNVQKQLSGERAKISKVKLENIGTMGQSITIEDVIDSTHPNFYAVPMMLSKPQSGAKATLRGEFNGIVVEIRQVPTDAESVVTKSASPQQGFVMGSLTTEKGSDGKDVAVFNATKIIVPWTGE
jgi:hypothetical protein